MRARSLALMIALECLGQGVAHAQSVRGVVTDGSAPVPGVVVILVDPGARELVRAFTNDRGEYRIVAPRAGDYRLRALRIGYRPQTSGLLSLVGDQTIARDLTLASVPTGLDTMRAVGRSACRMTQSDSTTATWQVWEQVRGAAAVAQLTPGTRGMAATTVLFTKTLEPIRRQVVREERNTRSEFASQPWRAATPAELHRNGYVIGDVRSGATFHAPSLDALLADEFLEDHCLRLVAGKDPALIGVAFEPNRERRDIPEIRGTAWVSRARSELRSLEYRYENADKDIEGFGGGEMEFVRMKNDTWAISSWSIRMPSLAIRAGARPGEPPVVEAIRVVGGELSLVTVAAGTGRDTLWARGVTASGVAPGAAVQASRTASFRGTVLSDSSSVPIADAEVVFPELGLTTRTGGRGEFRIDSIAAGSHQVVVRRAGHEPLDIRIWFAAGETVERRIVLPRVHDRVSIQEDPDTN